MQVRQELCTPWAPARVQETNKYELYELSAHKCGQALKIAQLLLAVGGSEEQRSATLSAPTNLGTWLQKATLALPWVPCAEAISSPALLLIASSCPSRLGSAGGDGDVSVCAGAWVV